MSAKPPFEAIVAAHGPVVLRVCRAMLGRADADDAWSETFLAALRAYPQLPGDANVQAWLVKIARNKAVDLARAARRRAVPVADLPERRPGDLADRSDLAGRPGLDLYSALAALPRRQREAVAYHYLGGLPYAEIAAITGSSAEAARRSASDGITRLRRSYPASGQNGELS